jgi:hypothetical protein
MTEYNPDSWVVIKMTHNDKTFYKVLGGWSSSYLYGDSWRLNSGIERVELEGDVYKFDGSSGSVYSCHKENYGLRASTAYVWDMMKEKYPDQVELLEDCDWSQLKFVDNA